MSKPAHPFATPPDMRWRNGHPTDKCYDRNPAPVMANHRGRWWAAFDRNDPSRECWADRVGA